MSSVKMSLPLSGIVPKEETNALEFLSENPTYDGRDVVIGILDTGVDPGAIGLQCTSSGATVPKVINMIDCSGSGDVDISNEVTATKVDVDGESFWEVTTLSGRKVRLSSELKLNPFPSKTENEEEKSSESIDIDIKADSKENEGEEKSTNIRLGIKRGFELFPAKLTSRVKKHRKILFDEKQRQHALKVRVLLDQWNKKYTPAKATSEQLKEKEDLESRLEILEPTNDTAGNDDGLNPWEDPGPIFDCIVYFDGDDYRVILVDEDESADVRFIKKGMTDYWKENEFKSFSSIDMYNYAVNFYDEGSVLSIVCDAGAHGSHVAGIASAYHPYSKSLPEADEEASTLEANINGVAPGAKIVSLKIGDSRLGSMETGTALTRALIEAIRLKVDVINLSYGEAAAIANSGRFIKLAEEAVQKHGIIFVSSAGNNGPALSTTGAPGGTCSSILSIGAYVSPNMMEAGYSLITQPKQSTKEISAEGNYELYSKKGEPGLDDDGNDGFDLANESKLNEGLIGSTYTWSSVGPATDGDQGVDLCAPGGAITCVPNWTLQRKQLMNGTSMSSPHAAGCIALLISAMKAVGIPVSFNRIKRALQNTAKTMPGLSNLQQGSGMIQVDKAWEYILKHKDDKHEDVEYQVSVNSADNPRGIYMRQPVEVTKKKTYTINVNPKFGNDLVDFDSQRERVEYEMDIVVESTESWVDSPDLFVLMNNGRAFKVTVDPTGLQPGVHTAHVHGYDAGNREKGPLFSVPITVIKPLKQMKNLNIGKLVFKPSEVKRQFLDVPEGATWMDVSIRDCRLEQEKDASARMIVLHSLQLLPHTPYRDKEKKRYLDLLPGQTAIASIPVQSGVTCELAVARYWSASGNTELEMDIVFRGLTPNKSELMMNPGGGGKSVIVQSILSDESLEPSGQLNFWLSPLKRKGESTISPLGERDVWPSYKKKIYQIVLSYEFEQEEAGGITIRIPSLQGYLYESAYESQFCMVYDSNKRLIGVSDSWPKEIKVPKGKVSIRLQVRHSNPEMLSKLKDQVIWIQRKLAKNVPLACYASHEKMMDGSQVFKKRTLTKGESAAIFFSEPKQDQLPKGRKQGDFMFGNVNYSKKGENLPGSGCKPGGFPIRYMIGPPDSKENSKGKEAEPLDERTELEKLEEAVLNLKVEELKKISTEDKDDTKFPDVFGHVLPSHSAHIPLLMVNLRHQDQEKWRCDRLQDIILASDQIIKEIDQNELILHYGVTGYYDKENGEACKIRSEMEKKKLALIEALARKSRAIADMENTKKSEKITCTFEEVMTDLQRWMKIDSNMKYAVLLLETEVRKKRYGSILKLINKLLEKNGDETKGGICHLDKAELLGRRAKVLELLGYEHLVQYDRTWKVISKPNDYALF